MKHTPRINRINDTINRAFPGNNDAWWVNNETRAPHEVTREWVKANVERLCGKNEN